MTTLLSRSITLAALAVALALPVAATAGPPGYALVDTRHLQGATRWDYLTVDPQGHRLFITRGDSVDVLDVTTGAIVGSIPDTKGVHGVALASELGKGFVSAGQANAVTVFDLATLKTVATIPVGTKPDAIVYDAAARRVFVANGGSGDLTAIDAGTDAVVGTVALGGRPEFAVVDGKGRLFVNLEDKSQLAVVDTASLRLIARYDLAPACESPAGLAIDTGRARLFASCRNRVMVVIDAASGRIGDVLAVGASSDAAVYDPGPKLAFSSNGDGTLTVVDASGERCQVVEIVRTVPTARTMALDPSSHRIYLVAAETDGVEPATADRPHPHPHFKPGSFMVLTVERVPRSPK